MTISSLAMMVVAIVLVWGGLVASAVYLWKVSNHEKTEVQPSPSEDASELMP